MAGVVLQPLVVEYVVELPQATGDLQDALGVDIAFLCGYGAPARGQGVVGDVWVEAPQDLGGDGEVLLLEELALHPQRLLDLLRPQGLVVLPARGIVAVELGPARHDGQGVGVHVLGVEVVLQPGGGVHHGARHAAAHAEDDMLQRQWGYPQDIGEVDDGPRGAGVVLLGQRPAAQVVGDDREPGVGVAVGGQLVHDHQGDARGQLAGGRDGEDVVEDDLQRPLERSRGLVVHPVQEVRDGTHEDGEVTGARDEGHDVGLLPSGEWVDLVGGEQQVKRGVLDLIGHVLVLLELAVPGPQGGDKGTEGRAGDPEAGRAHGGGRLVPRLVTARAAAARTDADTHVGLGVRGELGPKGGAEPNAHLRLLQAGNETPGGDTRGLEEADGTGSEEQVGVVEDTDDGAKPVEVAGDPSVGRGGHQHHPLDGLVGRLMRQGELCVTGGWQGERRLWGGQFRENTGCGRGPGHGCHRTLRGAQNIGALGDDAAAQEFQLRVAKGDDGAPLAADSGDGVGGTHHLVDDAAHSPYDAPGEEAGLERSRDEAGSHVTEPGAGILGGAPDAAAQGRDDALDLCRVAGVPAGLVGAGLHEVLDEGAGADGVLEPSGCGGARRVVSDGLRHGLSHAERVHAEGVDRRQ